MSKEVHLKGRGKKKKKNSSIHNPHKNPTDAKLMASALPIGGDDS